MKGLPLVLVAALSGLAQAAPFEHQHDSHTHGMARLELVLDDRLLELQLQSPAMNLVGFEHPAVEQAEREKVAQAVATLERGHQLFQLPETAACLLDETSVDQYLLETGTSSPDSHDHEHEHRDGKRDHAEFEVGYRFHCTSPALIDRLSVELFRYFPGLERLDVIMITPAGQRVLSLDAEHREVRF